MDEKLCEEQLFNCIIEKDFSFLVFQIILLRTKLT